MILECKILPIIIKIFTMKVKYILFFNTLYNKYIFLS